MVIANVTALPENKLRIEFADGRVSEIDSSDVSDDALAYAQWCRSGNRADPYIPPPPVIDLHRNLTPAEFQWLIAYTGLDEVYEGLIAHTKAEGLIGTYANLKATLARSYYELGITLDTVASLRDMAAQIAPEVDLSDATITAAWEMVVQNSESTE